eukprot:SAG31_NODE_572_length_13974_cov_28.935640_2_plen_361_part_00
MHQTKSNVQIARSHQVQNDGVDILVELTGHTANNRLDLMALRPAPVQVSWIGYPNTTGLDEIDYRITDWTCDPPAPVPLINTSQTPSDEAAHQAGAAATSDRHDDGDSGVAVASAAPNDTLQRFSERLSRLPVCFLCYVPHRPLLPVSPSPCRATGQVTFGTYNNLAKVQPEVLAVWAEILQRVPTSRLVLKSKSFHSPAACERFQKRFAVHGVGPERLELLGAIPHNTHHLQAYSCMDISLDTFPYAGTTTTFEALLMGVPLITLRGQTHVQNVGSSILTTLGRAEWVANTAQEYVEAAVRLATDIDALDSTRQGLRNELLSSPLCDAAVFINQLEDLYDEMWQSRAVGDQAERKPLIG